MIARNPTTIRTNRRFMKIMIFAQGEILATVDHSLTSHPTKLLNNCPHLNPLPNGEKAGT